MALDEKKAKWLEYQRRYNFINIWQKRYAHMLARHDGRATTRSGAEGKGIMDREEFFAWCREFENLDIFLAIYYDWAGNGFNRWDSPSIDRINSELGYVAGNIQWMSYSENCKKNNINPIDHSEENWGDDE